MLKLIELISDLEKILPIRYLASVPKAPASIM